MKYQDAVALVRKYGINFVEGSVVRTVDEALKVAKYPAVLKIVSDDVIHKTDKGCVKLNIEDADSLRRTYSEIVSNAGDAKVDGVLVQSMAKPGLEMIVGGRRDEQFGPVILFGLGGIFVEVFKDFSLRVCPLEEDDALEMIGEIEAYPLFKGVRGSKPVDIEAVVDVLQKVSKLLYENEQIGEMDINPIMVYEKGYCAVDVRVLP